MLIDFTEYELETIANAMEDYIQYDDEKLNTESLFGGLSVAERVNSIQTKIDNAESKRSLLTHTRVNKSGLELENNSTI